MTIKILFICQWNIWRSQIAEAFYNAKNKHKKAISAGIDDVWHKYGYKPYPPIVKIMQEDYNIDISQQTVKAINKEMNSQVEQIVLLTKQEECENTIPDYIYQHKWFKSIAIQDPNKQDQTTIKDIITDIKKIVEDLN